jgi:hypothetical protein
MSQSLIGNQTQPVVGLTICCPACRKSAALDVLTRLERSFALLLDDGEAPVAGRCNGRRI